MENFRGKRVFRDGKWQDGAAAPEQLREDLRGLPGEWVTKDDADPDRVHELDPPHIVSALVEEQVKKLAPEKQTLQGAVKAATVPATDIVPLTQARVDVVRFRVLHSLVTTALRLKQNGESAPVLVVKHLRFPTNNVNEYELHDGPPPQDSDLNPHERTLHLAIDPLQWPDSIIDMLHAKGITPPDLKLLVAECNRRIIT